MAKPIIRLVEARSLILHGLSENASDHEEYIAQFRQMARQIESAYDDWLLHTGRRQPRPIAGNEVVVLNEKA